MASDEVADGSGIDFSETEEACVSLIKDSMAVFEEAVVVSYGISDLLGSVAATSVSVESVVFRLSVEFTSGLAIVVSMLILYI